MTTLQDVLNQRSGIIKSGSAELIAGGNWSWALGTQTLTWDSNAYIQVIGIEDTFNTIPAGSVVLAPGEVAYVRSVIEATAVNNLTVIIADITLVPEGADVYIIARRDGAEVMIDNETRISDSQYLRIGQEHFDPSWEQLKMTVPNSNEVAIAAADFAFDDNIYSQSLDALVMAFPGTTIDFAAGTATGGVVIEGLGGITNDIAVDTEYLWYSMAFMKDAVLADNTISAKLLFTPAASTNSSPSAAPLPDLIGTKAVSTILVQRSGTDAIITTIRRISAGTSLTGAEIKALYEVEPSAFTDAQFTKLGGIEPFATADQTDVEIKTAYENNANTNAFTDAEQTKLGGIEPFATIDQTDVEIKTAYENNANTNAFTDAEQTKLGGIEPLATIDQTGAEIKALYEAETSAFTDAQFTKLGGIETLADVTDTANVDAAGATMNTDTSLVGNSYFLDEDNMASDDATKVASQQSIKSYVASELAAASIGVVTYISDYDAATNAPDLDTAPTGIVQGDMYVVSVDGTFFTEELEAGDQLIAKQDNPTTLAHWSITQANLTPATIKTKYESNADTNAFTDAEQTKLGGIETAATADQTGAEIKALYEAETSAFTDAQFTKLGGIETAATADQTDAEIKTAYENNADTNAFTDAEQTKLGGIETAATADQTGAEIKALYEAETSAFTDAQFTKLGGIETAATADQTGAEIKALYEAETSAFTDAQFTKLGGIETGATADQSAAEVVFTPNGDIAAAEVQAAIVEVRDDTDTKLSAKADDADVVKKDGSVTFTADQSMGNFKLTDLAAPVSANDAARLTDIQATAAGQFPKAPVDTVSLTNVLLTGEQLISGVTTLASDVLVAGNTDKTQNGIYTTAAGAWSRRADADGTPASEIKQGNMVLVVSGDEADTNFYLNATNAVDPAGILTSEEQEWIVYSRAEASSASLGVVKVGLDFQLADAAENTSGIQVASGAITLNDLGAFDTDDLTDAAATNKYTTAGDISKLAGIETAATADQTGAEIKTAYEAEANAFTDAQFTKLAGIETAATADQTGAEIKTAYEAEANAYTDTKDTKLAGIETAATADQTGAEIKALYEAEANAYTDAKDTKLGGIEPLATADQTDLEIKSAYENNADTNVFTNAEKLEVAANTAKVSFTEGAAVTANTAKVSADGSITTHSDVGGAAPVDTQVLTWVAANNQYEPGVGGGGGGGETFSDIPLVPSVTGNDITLGPSTAGGIDLVINGSALGRLTDTTVVVKPTEVTQYVATEYYSAVVTYNATTDTFDVSYSPATYASSALALAAAPTPNPFNFYVCKVSAQVTAVTPVSISRAIRTNENTDVFEYFDNPDLQTLTGTATFAAQSSNQRSRDLAVSNLNGTLAQHTYNNSTKKHTLNLYDINTLALLTSADSTTEATSTSGSYWTSIVYNSTTDKFVIFTAIDSYSQGRYLITHHDPLTGAETSGTAGFRPANNDYNEFPKYLTYLPTHDKYVGAHRNPHGGGSPHSPPEPLNTYSDVDFAVTAISGAPSGLNDGALGFDIATNELWWYDHSDPTQVYDVSASGTLTIAYNRDEPTTPNQHISYGTVASYDVSGVTVDTITGVEVVDTRGVITESLSPGPLYASGAVTISSPRSYDTLVINGNLSITAATTVTGDVFVDGDLTVDASCVFRGALTVLGEITVNSPLSVVGNITGYDLTIATPNDFDFSVKGSLLISKPAGDSNIISANLFNVGGDIKGQDGIYDTDMALNPTYDPSRPTMFIGGNVYLDSFNITIQDDGVSNTTNQQVLEVGGAIYLKVGSRWTSDSGSADRRMCPGMEVRCRGFYAQSFMYFYGGDNSFASTNAYGGANATLISYGDFVCASNVELKSGRAFGAEGRGGTVKAVTVRGNMTSDWFQFQAGASTTAGDPYNPGNALNVSGNATIRILVPNNTETQRGAGPVANMPGLSIGGTLAVTFEVRFNNYSSGSAVPQVGFNQWTAGEFRFKRAECKSDRAPPGSIRFLGYGFCRMSIGQYEHQGTRLMPGTVAGAVGSATEIPADIHTSNSGTAVHRDTTGGTGTNYVWRLT